MEKILSPENSQNKPLTNKSNIEALNNPSETVPKQLVEKLLSEEAILERIDEDAQEITKTRNDIDTLLTNKPEERIIHQHLITPATTIEDPRKKFIPLSEQEFDQQHKIIQEQARIFQCERDIRKKEIQEIQILLDQEKESLRYWNSFNKPLPERLKPRKMVDKIADKIIDTYNKISTYPLLVKAQRKERQLAEKLSTLQQEHDFYDTQLGAELKKSADLLERLQKTKNLPSKNTDQRLAA